MSIVGGIVIFLCSWWIFFLMLLPWGVNRNIADGATRFGAPAKSALGWKVIVSTLAASLFLGGLNLADFMGLLDLRSAFAGS